MNNLGVYIHIPFCQSKCPYCDFYSLTSSDNKMKNYTLAVVDNLCKIEKSGRKADSLYLGGGTPSILGEDMLSQILDSAKPFLTKGAEITIECNPKSSSAKLFGALSRHGVNRISMGMQSAVAAERKALGRSCDKDDVLRNVEYAKASGISNISLDLMLGVPKMTLSSLDESLEFIEKADVTHLSAYMLKIEENTPFFVNQAKLDLPSEDDICQMYLHTVEELEKMGLHQYEISNFAKSTFESRHNLKYWQCDEYLGIGPSAHSFVDGKRFYYPRDIEYFLASKPPIPDGNGGDNEEQLLLSLRLNKGAKKSLLNKNGLEKCIEYEKHGLMTISHDRVALTPKGFLLSNSIIIQLI